MKSSQILEIILRFIPILSIGVYCGFRMGSEPTAIDAIVIVVVTAVTVGIWAVVDNYNMKKYGDTSYFFDFISSLSKE